MLVPLVLSVVLHRSDDRTTATVTPAQVHAHPEATLLYPHGTLVATRAMTGTTILIARYQNYGCSYRNCHTFIGYDSPRVNGGYVSRLFATGDGPSQVLAWYRHEMARRGWTLGALRHSRDMDLTRFIQVGQLPDSCQPDDFVLYTGQPRAVSAIVGKPVAVAHPSRRQTLFSTRYTLYPDDAAQVLSNYCPLGALRQWHDATASNDG